MKLNIQKKDSSLWQSMMTTAASGMTGSVLENHLYARQIEEAAFRQLKINDLEMARGKPDLKRERQVIRQLVDKLANASEADTRQIVSNWLARGIAYGCEELGWKVPLPAQNVRVQLALPVIREVDGLNRTPYLKLDRLFVGSLKRIEELSQMERVGQIIYAVISRSGVQKTAQLKLLVESQAEDWCIEEGETWYEPDSLIEDIPPLRINSDLVTGRLIALYVDDFSPRGNMFTGSVWQSLKAFWLRVGTDEAVLPRNVPELLVWARGYSSTELPSLVAALAMGRGVQPGVVSKETYLRLLTGKPVVHRCAVVDEIDQIADEQPLVDREAQAIMSRRPLSQQAAFLSHLSQGLGRLNPKAPKQEIIQQVEQVVNQNPEPLTFIERLVVLWVFHIVHTRGKKKRGLAVSSLQRYFSGLKSGLLKAFSDVDARDLDASEWLVRLQQAIYLRTDGKTGSLIGDFANFVRRHRDVPDFDPGLLEGASSDPVRVDANLVAPLEFEKAMDLIQRIERMDRIIRLGAALTSYCGLRPEEITDLRLRDVQGRGIVRLHVRNSSYKDRKTPNAVRTLCVLDMLPLHWRTEFMEWVRLRDQETGNPFSNHFLFNEVDDQKIPLEPSRITDPVTKVLRQVTGDETLVYYHLRHSFATWFLIRMLSVNEPGLLTTGMAVFQHELFSSQSCNALYEAIGFGNGSSGNILHQLAYYMGHEYADITLRNYIHLCEWIIPAMLSVNADSLPENAIKALTRNGSYWYEIRKSLKQASGDWDLKALRKRWGKCRNGARKQHPVSQKTTLEVA